MRSQAHDFSFTLDFAHVGAHGIDVALEASPEQKKALAERFGVLIVEDFAATARITREDVDKARVKGDFHAKVEQTCGITLEPFTQDVAEEFDLTFKETAPSQSVKNEYVLDMDGDFEPMERGKMDIGETLVELLSLALDAFPKKKDAVFSYADDDADGGEPAKSPFAALEALKAK